MSQPVKSDADLLQEARRDPTAFRIVCERHVARVFSLLRHETGDVDVAMDLTAETFARALAGAQRFVRLVSIPPPRRGCSGSLVTCFANIAASGSACSAPARVWASSVGSTIAMRLRRSMSAWMPWPYRLGSAWH